MDDHQTYVQARGLRDDRDPFILADDYGDDIEETWRAVGICMDVAVRPRVDPDHVKMTQQFFRSLYDNGHLVARRSSVPWCVSCDRWLVEAYAIGQCPHCGQPSGGNACEACGQPNKVGDLGEPECVLCGSPAELRECERLFFPLKPFEEELVAWWGDVSMPPHLRALCEGMRAGGLPEIAVTQPGDWGIAVPVEGYEEQRIYVWFEMAPGYLVEAQRAASVAEVNSVDQLLRQSDVPFIQFFGFDNGYFHAVLFPALFRAYDPTIRLATHFVVNEFYRLEGKKFSTSRRHAVWAQDLLRTESTDVIRWHVLRDRPEGQQTNFTAEDLSRTRNNLAESWDGWLRRLTTAVADACGGVVPSDPAAGPACDLLREQLLSTAAQLRQAYSPDSFNPRRAVRLLEEALTTVSDFGHLHEHAAAQPTLAHLHRSALAAQLAAVAALAAWSGPIAPDLARRAASLVGYTGPLTAVDEALAPLAVGRPVSVLSDSVLGSPALPPGEQGD